MTTARSPVESELARTGRSPRENRGYFIGSSPVVKNIMPPYRSKFSVVNTATSSDIVI